ncbi:hypothetical protein [Calothrix sp. PCC 7507]|uniref:hypothetical protein n=1 Tax=Calothrix sp. PCC 7507 TaxID=99598 RepID=UPI00029F05A3|nr:hypothetical protein [Calothrix sp. PCC 7507]AFY35819.1 hypothetical protein Cal7507_5487 [Calothrix sp. PCC 7507]
MTLKGQIETPPETLISPLLELRDYYARITEEYERLYTQARSQLNHVEALLSNWSTSDTNHQISIVGVTRETPTSIPGETRLSLSPANISDVELESTASAPQDSHNSKIDNSASATDINQYQDASTSLESNDHSGKILDIPMLPEYQGLTRMEAIKKLLQENIGTVCHIDFVVRSLYGELESHVFKVVKGRVQSSLTQGREKNNWCGIPEEPGCYTLDLGLLSSSNGSNGHSKTVKPKKKPLVFPKTKIVPMLSAFEGQFLIDAISSLLKKHAGKIFTVAEVIAGLYGNIDAEETREIKSKVLNELSRGYRTGRFSKIPDKIGLYTWDVKLALAQKV